MSSAVHSAQLALLNAPFASGGWTKAIEQVAIATRSSAAQLIGFGGPTLLSLNVIGGEIVGNRAHLDDPALYGPCNWRINSVGAAMAIQHEEHYRGYAVNRDTADYDDAVADVDLPFGCQSALFLEERWAVGLSLLRRRRDGPCDGDVLRDFAHLRRHAARAVMMQMALDEDRAEIVLGDLSDVHQAVLLIDRHGQLRALSEAAEPLFDDHGPLRLVHQALLLRDSTGTRQLHLAIGRLLDGDAIHGPVVHRFAIRAGAEQKSQWMVTLMRLPNAQGGLGFCAHLAMIVDRLDKAEGRKGGNDG